MFTERDLLHVEGKKLVNQDGKEVILRGTSLGGWLHREGWMDGGGACLSPLKPVMKAKTVGCLIFEFDEVRRCNRVRVEGDISGIFKISTSLDGMNWNVAAAADFALKGIAKLDNMRPAPYAPGVNVYEEGVFVQGDVIHTNEFFTKYLMIEANGITDAQPMRYGDIDEYNARALVEHRFGVEKAEELLDIYQDCYIRESDIDYIRELGFNFVRVPIYWQEIMDKEGKIKENAWENIDWLLELCREKEIYVMLDYHAAPGGNTMGSITAGQLDSNELWENETYQQMSMDILVAMASRYQGHPEVACYDLLNEPTTLPVPYVVPDMTGIELPTTPTLFYKLPERMSMPVRNFYKEAYAKIRKVDTKHILCVQQFADLNLIEQKEAYGWENVMYQFHCYPVGDWRDHDSVEASMRAYLEAVKESYAKWTSPAFAGEFCCWEFTDVWEKWVHALNELGISWAHWSYKIADPVEKDNWSLFYDYDGVYVDYYQDSYEQIAEKWGTYNTEHYKHNEKLAKLLKKYAAE